MLAAILKDYHRLELEDVPKPTPKPNEVVVRVKATGICATDYKAIVGKRRNVTFPIILGHENAGVVDSVGSMVKQFSEGDKVILSPRHFCGLCENCRTGFYHYCEFGYTTGGDGGKHIHDGGFAEYMVCEESCVFAKPGEISFEAGALAEPLSGAWKGVIQYSQLSIGEDVVIIGVGGIGMLCLMVAARAGAGSVVAVDVSDFALQNAKKLGATHILNLNMCDIREEVFNIIPRGPDLIVESAGPIEAVKLMTSLRRRGTRMNLFGITTHEEFSMDGGRTHFMETRMDASFSTTPLAMTKAIRLMERNLIDPEQIISHRFPLAEIHDAIEAMSQSNHNKVMIVQE